MYRTCAFLLLWPIAVLASGSPTELKPIPLSFEAGDASGESFISHPTGAFIEVSPNEMHVTTVHRSSHDTSVALRFVGANPQAKAITMPWSGASTNYLIGNDRSRWRMGIPLFREVKYRGVYPGIDLAYYGHEGHLEYDLLLAAGANSKTIRMAYSGAARVHVDSSGDLILSLADGEIRQHRPYAYQENGSIRQRVDAHFVVQAGEIGIRLGRYDHRRPLVIDPVLSYATYLGGKSGDTANGVGVDSAGNVYVAGMTSSPDLPTSQTVLQPSSSIGSPELFISKLDPKGALVYTTYLGGSGTELFGGFAVDAAGNAYIATTTDSTNLPVTDNVFQAYNRGGYFGLDGYIAKLDPNGSKLLFGTYLGGNDDDLLTGLAVDKSGAVYVTGTTDSPNFPVTPTAFQKTNKFLNSWVTKLSADATQTLYSTLVGGSGSDVPGGITIDSAGNAYVVGHTDSKDFPTTSGAIQTVHHGGTTDMTDAFIYKLNPQGSQLLYSTFLGGTDDDYAVTVTVDGSGNAFVAGYTASTDFPTTKGALQTGLVGIDDAFIAKINPQGTALGFCTLLGGTRSERAGAIVLDSVGNIYVSGSTTSTSFPVLAPFQTSLRGGADAYVAELDPAGSKVLQASFLGGTGDEVVAGAAFDSQGGLYLAGNTASANFPVFSNAAQLRFGGGANDGFLAKVSFSENSLALAISPSQLVFQGTVKTALTAQPLAISNVGGALVPWAAQVLSGSGWLSINPKSGFAGAAISVSADSTGLDAGSYQGSIGITNQVTGAQLTVPVTLTLTPAAVTGGQISQNGILNAAGNQNGPVAPGEMVTIYGSGIGPAALTPYSITADGTLANVLADTRVLFDGTAAPLVYVAAGQVSAIVPYGVAGQSSTRLQVEYKGVKSNAVSLSVAACAPAIFTADSSGKGQGSITNQDVSFNSKSNPADRASIVTFYATGEGQTDPPGTDGKLANTVFPKPILPVSVKIGGADAEVIYFGAAPLAVAGLMQVNARVPDGLTAGDQSLVLQVGQCSSPDGVTVAVR